MKTNLLLWAEATIASDGLLGLPGPASFTAITLNSYLDPSCKSGTV